MLLLCPVLCPFFHHLCIISAPIGGKRRVHEVTNCPRQCAQDHLLPNVYMYDGVYT